MPNHEFIFSGKQKVLSANCYGWKAPSNIALVKYWGKHDLQLPKNSSVSFTLSQCATQTFLHFTPKSKASSKIDFEVIFEGKSASHFHEKINTFFHRIKEYVPFIEDYQFKIETQNSFPHSSGIASSASGFAALALCIMQLESTLNPEISQDYFYKKAGFLARLGSGSAARSILGPVVIWGKHPDIPESSDEYGIPNSFSLHPVFKDYQNTILIVDKGKKQVSSSLGHDLMHHHPYAEQRFKWAYKNTENLIEILKNGNLKDFIELVESEALSLHAMMMTSLPYFLLMKPNTLEIINQIWNFREESDCHLCFTLDAGANVHLLYPYAEKEAIQAFIQDQLIRFCQNGESISDQIGNGAKRLK